MIYTKKEERELYKDAMYFYLINKGYSSKKAEFIVKKIFSNNENII